mmetsp:Transcript_8222/g.30011  ORF Transcript_8222/g.30011 Transcript_8222/m.30011 type:complete len:329 (+) Transcript_8222:1031-2017(+)
MDEPSGTAAHHEPDEQHTGDKRQRRPGQLGEAKGEGGRRPAAEAALAAHLACAPAVGQREGRPNMFRVLTLARCQRAGVGFDGAVHRRRHAVEAELTILQCLQLLTGPRQVRAAAAVGAAPALLLSAQPLRHLHAKVRMLLGQRIAFAFGRGRLVRAALRPAAAHEAPAAASRRGRRATAVDRARRRVRARTRRWQRQRCGGANASTGRARRARQLQRLQRHRGGDGVEAHPGVLCVAVREAPIGPKGLPSQAAAIPATLHDPGPVVAHSDTGGPLPHGHQAPHCRPGWLLLRSGTVCGGSGRGSGGGGRRSQGEARAVACACTQREI